MSWTWVLAPACTLARITMTSLHENNFHITGLCDLNPPAAYGFLSQEGPVMHRFCPSFAFPWTSRSISSGIVDLGHAMMTPMWSHWNVMVTIYKHYSPNPWQLDWNVWIYKWICRIQQVLTNMLMSRIELACKLFMIFIEKIWRAFEYACRTAHDDVTK